MDDLRIKTTRPVEARDITSDVARMIKDIAGEGHIVHVYTPHTTCGIMINEHADPDVVKDIMEGLERLAPRDYPYRHGEGNSHAHIRSALIGTSVTIPLRQGRMALGTWQGIFLMEFDGPRERRVTVTIV